MDQIYYNELTHIPQPGKNLYNPETYLGNWYEETVRNTLKRDDFLRKRECGDLTIQRTQTMVDLLLKPVDLTANADNYLHYGDTVQIMTPGPSCKTAMEVYPFKRTYYKMSHLVLSAAVPPTAIDLAPYLNTDSIISASSLLYPVIRNSFIIEHPDCPTKVGSVVNYGDVFRIRTFDTQHFPLYLLSSPGIRLHSSATYSAKPKVRLSDLTISDTLWCAHPLNPFEKLKMELGVPIPLKSRLLLKHNGSGHNLSTESNFQVLTYFEDEYEVTVDSKFDKTRRPTFENIWYFDTERGWPKSTDPCDKAFEEQAKFSAKINANAVTQSAADSAKEEEAARKAAEGDDEEEEDEQLPPTSYQMSQAQDIGNTESMLSQLSLKSKDGQRPYNPMTGPQPHAYSYTVRDNSNYPLFPNQRWCCGDTNCCGTSSKPTQTQAREKIPPCEKCECVEPGPPPENLYAPIRLIM